MALNVPAIATGAVVASVLASMVALTTGTTTLSMVPGNTVLGYHHIWNVITCHFVESNVGRLLMACAVLLMLANKAVERLHPPKRVASVVTVALGSSGLVLSFAGLMSYMGTGDEQALYSPRNGMTGLVGAYAVLAWQALGDAPLFADVPWLPACVVPFIVLVGSAWLQYLVGTGTDLPLGALATLIAWVQLRFIVPVSPGGVAGDARPEFELVHGLPPALRVPVRPVEKLGSAICLPLAKSLSALLPVYTALGAADGVVGGSFASLPTTSTTSGLGLGGSSAGVSRALFSGTVGADATPSTPAGDRATYNLHLHLHGGGPAGVMASPHGTSIYVGDPVAERRKERALRRLEERMAEMKAKMKGTGAVPATRPGSTVATASP